MFIINSLGIIPTIAFSIMILFHKKLQYRQYLVRILVVSMPILALFGLGGTAGLSMLQMVSIFIPKYLAVLGFALLIPYFFHAEKKYRYLNDPVYRKAHRVPRKTIPEPEPIEVVSPIQEKWDAYYLKKNLMEKKQKEEQERRQAELERKRLATPVQKVLPKIVKPYTVPSVNLFTAPKQGSTGYSAEYYVRKGVDLMRAYKNFGIETKLHDFILGPTVTTYRLKTAVGTRYNKLINLEKEVMGALEATSVRTVAPIVGTSFVGVEVPHDNILPVYFRTMLDNFPKDSTPTTVALGKSNTGEYVYCDLAKMPHMIVAGTTGSGKSVALQGMITSMLCRNTPDQLQLALIDPKQAEFSAYENLPHLYAPVVYNEIPKARELVRKLVTEMENRGSLFKKVGVKDIKSYNKKHKPLPYIMVFVEEYADLAMADSESSKSDGPTISSSICRIAQKARSAGIHLVIATQRPSADALPPLVRSNLPSAIACMVRSEADSKIILGETGAEALIGNGDMLYKPNGANALQRLQGVFVKEDEIKTIVNHYRRGA